MCLCPGWGICRFPIKHRIVSLFVRVITSLFFLPTTSIYKGYFGSFFLFLFSFCEWGKGDQLLMNRLDRPRKAASETLSQRDTAIAMASLAATWESSLCPLRTASATPRDPSLNRETPDLACGPCCSQRLIVTRNNF